jgi:hypothetical protein
MRYQDKGGVIGSAVDDSICQEEHLEGGRDPRRRDRREASNGKEAVDKYFELKPDLV